MDDTIRNRQSKEMSLKGNKKRAEKRNGSEKSRPSAAKWNKKNEIP